MLLSLWLKSVFDGQFGQVLPFTRSGWGRGNELFLAFLKQQNMALLTVANCQGFRTVADWIDKQYLPGNRSRLKAAHSYLTGELQGLDVPYVDRPAAMFVWADLRKVGHGG